MARSRVAGGRRARFSAAYAEQTTVLSGVAKREYHAPVPRGIGEALPPFTSDGVCESEASLHPNPLPSLASNVALESHPAEQKGKVMAKTETKKSAHILLANVRQGLTISTAVNCARILVPAKSRSHVTAVTLHVRQACTSLLLI
jgi:hypothetical protein